MSRLSELIEHYQITIETTARAEALNEHPATPVPLPFTLRYHGRSLTGTMISPETVSCEEALSFCFGALSVLRAGRMHVTVPPWNIALEKKRELRAFLRPHYEEFWLAYLLDKRIRLSRWERVLLWLHRRSKKQ
jgi:hypothetical protein